MPVARRATQRPTADAMRKASALAQCINAVSVGASHAPTIERAIQFAIQLICDFLVLPVAHARFFAERLISLGTPANVWHFRSSVRREARRPGHAEHRLEEKWYSRVVDAGRPFVCDDITAAPDFPWKRMAGRLSLKAELLVPILIHDQVMGVVDFFSYEPFGLDRLRLELMAIMGGRLGYVIEYKRAERNIQDLSRKLFRAKYDERRRLAQELHDTTAQNLAAIVMDLEVIEQNAQALDSTARRALSKSVSLARQSLQEVRTFSYLLHPPMLRELGLLSALRVYVEGFSQRSGMRVDFWASDCLKLPTEVEVAVFHLVQEGLTNAHHHSRSPWAKVRMSADAHEVRISVENKTTAAVTQKTGIGLRSMQERVQHLGGRLVFHSDEHRTVLAASLPLFRLVKGRKAKTSGTARVRESSRKLGEAPELRS